jgi:hypothetical protein
MADSEAQTGVGTRSGSTLDPKRMTDRERKALRASLTKRITAQTPKTEIALSTAEKTVEEAGTAATDLATITADLDADAAAAAITAETEFGRATAFETLATNGVDEGSDEEDGDLTDTLAEFYARIAGDAAANRRAAGESAYNLLFEQFSQYGLGALVEPLRGFIEEGLSPAEFTIRLRGTDAYKKRFAANAQRVGKGLRALSEAEYIDLEDQYQSIMRNYGLPESYYTRGELGRQEGFEKFIAGDVSAAELEDRIGTAYNRVINANPEVSQALREFYPDITNGDILAYALDPDKALTSIKRKVTAAEIGGAAMGQGLATGLSRAEELARFGVTGAQAREGFQAVAGVLPRAQMLGNIYAKQGLGEYTQATAEQEVFGLTGSAEAERKRRKLSELEQAQFAGSSGAAQGALARERAGSF